VQLAFCVGILEILNLHLDIKMVEQVAHISNTKTAYAEFLSKSTFLYVVCFLLGNSPASEFYMPTFRNTLSVPSS